MTVSVDICLRGENAATTVTFDLGPRTPGAWTDEDVQAVLEGMLRAMDRQHRPADHERPVTLRGLSWIVNAYDEGGVVIAIEITLGAAVAGPFDIEKGRLEAMIERVLKAAAQPAIASSNRIH
jgi:hypothetical protein